MYPLEAATKGPGRRIHVEPLKIPQPVTVPAPQPEKVPA